MNRRSMQSMESDLLPGESSSMVLLVDDQAIVAQAVKRLLDGLTDIDLHYCSDAMEAVKVAVQIKPNVILQDLIMPGINGLELVRLTRDVKIQETLVTLLTQQLEQARIVEAKDIAVVETLDRGVPAERPSKPRLALNLAVALARRSAPTAK